MFEPTRGGTRGGQAEFKWTDVSADKDREHYLGHSINAPTGRWQKNKDVHWYNRDQQDGADEKRAEIQRIKQLEADALAVALGFDPAPKDAAKEPAPSLSPVKAEPEESIIQRTQDKEDKRRRKAEKKAKKLAKLERKALERGKDPSSYQRRVTRDRSRSRSPPRRDDSRSNLPRRRSRERDHHLPRPSQSPNRPPDHHSERRAGGDYNADERERERERDRRRWNSNARRELPSSYR